MLYVAFDGSYGDSEGMVVVDNDNFDEHFYEYLDGVSEWLRPSYAQRFESNDHNFIQGNKEWECEECEQWLKDEN